MVLSTTSSSSSSSLGNHNHNHNHNHHNYTASTSSSSSRHHRFSRYYERCILIVILNFVLIGLIYNHMIVTKQSQQVQSPNDNNNNNNNKNKNNNNNKILFAEQKKTGFKILDEKKNERLLLLRSSSSNNNNNKNKNKNKGNDGNDAKSSSSTRSSNINTGTVINVGNNNNNNPEYDDLNLIVAKLKQVEEQRDDWKRKYQEEQQILQQKSQSQSQAQAQAHSNSNSQRQQQQEEEEDSRVVVAVAVVEEEQEIQRQQQQQQLQQHQQHQQQQELKKEEKEEVQKKENNDNSNKKETQQQQELQQQTMDDNDNDNDNNNKKEEKEEAPQKENNDYKEEEEIINSKNDNKKEGANNSNKEKVDNDNNDNDNDKSDNDDDKLNIILFYADDWTMNVIGKLNKNVYTPNIDNMADNGIMFINNCVTTSVCWISRATLMTGLYYSRHLQSKPHVDNMFTSVNWNETLFPLLKNAGYYTGIIGKWHAPNIVEYMSSAFNEYTKLYFGEHWLSYYSKNGTMEHVTELNKRHSLDFLRERPNKNNKNGQKFALKVSFFATHAWDGREQSYQPMNETRDKYYPDNTTTTTTTTTTAADADADADGGINNNNNNNNYVNQNIIPPKTATDKHWKELPWFFNEQTAGRGRWRNRFEPHIWQKNIRDLYSMATEVDFAIGEIINELKVQGVYNNTMLIFTTDNGDLHGEHGLVEKWYPFEESIKVPLIIVDPRMSPEKKGTINKEFTLNIDLAPTILGAAGIEASDFMQGRDISELYLDLDEEEETTATTTKNDQHQQQQQQQHLNNNHTTTASRGRRLRQLTDVDDAKNTSSSLSSSPSLKNKNKNKNKNKLSSRKRPWRKDWFYEWNMGHPSNASGHEQEHFIDAAFALITKEWKYIYWPQKQYEQLYHRSIDIYDEYDIIQNYYILSQGKDKDKKDINSGEQNNIFQQPEEEYMKIRNKSFFNITKTNPIGDSIQSTKEIYNTLKARFYELKQHVQTGYKV